MSSNIHFCQVCNRPVALDGEEVKFHPKGTYNLEFPENGGAKITGSTSPRYFHGPCFDASFLGKLWALASKQNDRT